MPLWTIFTKWPEPAGPQWRNPSSAVPGLRPADGATSPRPGASVRKIGSSRATAAARADVEVVDALLREQRRAAHVVLPERVAAVDDRVALLEKTA
jgi:hypothetical protein